MVHTKQEFLNKIADITLTGSMVNETKESLVNMVNNSNFDKISAEVNQRAFHSLRKTALANQKHLRKVERVSKKVYRLESHLYAPELNTLHMKDGSSHTVKGCLSIKDAVLKIVNNF